MIQVNDIHLVFNKRLERDKIIRDIQARLHARDQTISQAIEQRSLYFRVSLLGACNLHCIFCHNEGAPTSGRAEIDFVFKAMVIAKEIGFCRVQFTGGEPLLHPKVADFVREAKKIFSDVGITTNGTFLHDKLDDLIMAGITRIHISLQEEALLPVGATGKWSIPTWLKPALENAAKGLFNLRLNMPVPAHALSEARNFLEDLSTFNCDVKVFSILPEGIKRDYNYPLERLQSLVDSENARRSKNGIDGRVFLRGFKAPRGIRCPNCKSFANCKEQSHSLRLGADNILRPCLATRDWDIPVNNTNLSEKLLEATLLALDYVW